MRILVVSDSHMYNDILEDITKRWKNKVDLLVHCGDSSLLPDDPLLKDYNIVVHGNHDEEVFPHYIVVSLTVVSNFSLTKSLKTLIISMLLSFFIVKFVKINVLIWANVCYNGHRR